MKVFPADQVATDHGGDLQHLRQADLDAASQIDAEILANYLRNEYPQRPSPVVLSRVRPDHAARVLTMRPDDFADGRGQPPGSSWRSSRRRHCHIEETLRLEFVGAVAQTSRRDAHETMAEVSSFRSPDRKPASSSGLNESTVRRP